MGLQQSALEEVVEGAVQVLGDGVGLFCDYTTDQIVGTDGQYVSGTSEPWCASRTEAVPYAQGLFRGAFESHDAPEHAGADIPRGECYLDYGSWAKRI